MFVFEYVSPCFAHSVLNARLDWIHPMLGTHLED